MKHTINLILCLVLFACSQTLFAQNKVDSEALAKCKKQVADINGQALYKKVVFTNSIQPEEQITVTDYRDEADYTAVYFDNTGRIRKYISMFSYPEAISLSICYFDLDGYELHLACYHSSAMDDAATGVKYLKNDKLVYMDVSVQGENGKVVKQIEQYGGKTKVTNDWSFDKILHADSITVSHELKGLAEIDECVKVIFTSPKVGEKTIVNVKRANIRQAASNQAKIVTSAELGTIVTIAEDIPDWYKITFANTTGYIHKTLVEPVEHIVKKKK